MNILIVESKAKCKTLLKHLGKDEWRVMPTGGHVERLAGDLDALTEQQAQALRNAQRATLEGNLG